MEMSGDNPGGMTREIRPAPSRIWTDDRGLSIFLATLVAIIVVPALGAVGLPGRFLGDALVSLMLVSGARRWPTGHGQC